MSGLHVQGYESVRLRSKGRIKTSDKDIDREGNESIRRLHIVFQRSKTQLKITLCLFIMA